MYNVLLLNTRNIKGNRKIWKRPITSILSNGATIPFYGLVLTLASINLQTPTSNGAPRTIATHEKIIHTIYRNLDM